MSVYIVSGGFKGLHPDLPPPEKKNCKNYDKLKFLEILHSPSYNQVFFYNCDIVLTTINLN